MSDQVLNLSKGEAILDLTKKSGAPLKKVILELFWKPDGLKKPAVGHRPLRPWPAPWRGRRFRCAAAAIDPRSRDAPGAADPGDTVAATRGDRDDGAHRFDLRAAKGTPPPPASSRSIFA